MELNGHLHDPAALPPGEESRCQYRDCVNYRTILAVEAERKITISDRNLTLAV